MIAAKELEEIGLSKVMEFLEIRSKEEFLNFLIDIRCPTLPLLSEYLSQVAIICQY